MTVDEMMEWVQVHTPEEVAYAAEDGGWSHTEGWWAVSVASAGFVAFFATEQEAWRYRWWRIHRLMQDQIPTE